jgi:hypothetical protein
LSVVDFHSHFGKREAVMTTSNSFPQPGTTKKIIRLLSSSCALFLCLYVGAVLPLHHHDDGLEHSDCVLCLAQIQPVETAAIFFIALFVTAWTALIDISVVSTYPNHVDSYQSRAPPASILAT